MFGSIKKIFQKSKTIFKEDFNLEFAFRCNGVDYFEFKDKNNMPYQRGLEALTFFEELQNGVTKDYLKKHCEVVKSIIQPQKGKPIDLQKLYIEVARLEERLNFIINKDIIYKVASVAFVTKDEPLLKYDFDFNKKKIEDWQKYGDGFFLYQPLKKLIPFLNEYGESSLIYLRVVEKVEELHRVAHSLALLETELRNEKD